MQVLKVVLEGETTSFRYPHFMIGVQPSFLMPPPSTIYGHICSALGDWVSPYLDEGMHQPQLAFAYHFTYLNSFEDLEHVHVLSAAGGTFSLTATEKYTKVQEGRTNPFRRMILFRPKLTLYINRPEWLHAFREPRHAVVLGRTQDVAEYTDVRVVDLESSHHAYFEHTLLPYDMAAQTAVGVVTSMPRWIDYEQNRQPFFARYLILQRRVFGHELMRFDQEPFLVDPTSTLVKESRLGLIFHTFVEGTRIQA